MPMNIHTRTERDREWHTSTLSLLMCCWWKSVTTSVSSKRRRTTKKKNNKSQRNKVGVLLYYCDNCIWMATAANSRQYQNRSSSSSSYSFPSKNRCVNNLVTMDEAHSYSTHEHNKTHVESLMYISIKIHIPCHDIVISQNAYSCQFWSSWLNGKSIEHFSLLANFLELGTHIHTLSDGNNGHFH